MTTIKIIEHGPALIISDTKDIIINESQGQTLYSDKDTIAICRCGLSKNGIYCDGSHKSRVIINDLTPKNNIFDKLA